MSEKKTNLIIQNNYNCIIIINKLAHLLVSNRGYWFNVV